MRNLYLVIDTKGVAQPFNDFKSAKSAFERMVVSLRQVQASNMTFSGRFVDCKIDKETSIKQYHARYSTQRNGKTFWVNDLFSLQQIQIDD